MNNSPYELMLVKVPVRDHAATNHDACAGLTLRDDAQIVAVKWTKTHAEVTVLIPSAPIISVSEGDE